MVKCIMAVKGKCKIVCSGGEEHEPETMSGNKDCATTEHYCDAARCFVKCIPVIEVS